MDKLVPNVITQTIITCEHDTKIMYDKKYAQIEPKKNNTERQMRTKENGHWDKRPKKKLGWTIVGHNIDCLTTAVVIEIDTATMGNIQPKGFKTPYFYYSPMSSPSSQNNLKNSISPTIKFQRSKFMRVILRHT